MCPRAGGGAVNTAVCFQQKPMAWDWLRLGLSLPLWLLLFRVRGGFVFPLRWCAFGFGFGSYARRLFRFSLMSVRVLVLVLFLRVWHWSWKCAAVSVYFALCSASRVGRPTPKIGKFA